MPIEGIESVINGGSETSNPQSKILDKDDFLNLLITQLQNQDPLNPTDSVEFTAQLAQFSSLEQLGNVNNNLQQLQQSQALINHSQTVSFIGKDVLAKGDAIYLTEDVPVQCHFELAADAQAVVVSIYDASGEFVKAINAELLGAGRHALNWDGTDKDGNRVAQGRYTFEVLAAGVDNQSVGVNTLTSGRVTGVTFSNQQSFLIAGEEKIAFEDVVQVTEADHLPLESDTQQKNKFRNDKPWISEIDGGRL